MTAFHQKLFLSIYYSQVHTTTMHIKFCQTALQCVNSKKPYTQAGFEPGIICSVGGRDDHYATPP
jgi:hypothetical protein